ncbi:mitochondrial 54S ribosomal mL50 protein [Aspergillus undulatus]|uniref:mitochondrial 54S ribosomal mL50 protein n=1 Tax=Aspergillus undulatus TaxID=1810928 RepID=UPI003CCDF07E
MRSSLRLLNLEVTPLQGSRTRYVCSTCRQESRPRPFVARQFLRNASDSSTPITERVRRKLWGTDNPPGLKDPYGGEGVFEKKFKKSQASRQAQEGENAPTEIQQEAATEEAVEETTSGDYIAATTWEGLDRVGHLGRWKDLPPKEADAYNSFFSNRQLTQPGHLALAAHQTAVEISMMQSLKKNPLRVCDVVEHEQPIFEMIYNCKIQFQGNRRAHIYYPNEETRDALKFVFEQIGSPPKAAPKAEQTATGEGAEKAESEAEAAAEAETEEVEEAEAPQPSAAPFFGYQDVKDKGVFALPLVSADTKFAFLKRFSQLSGHYFPDVAIESITTVQQMLSYVNKTLEPKPKKLAEHLVANEAVTSLPNVKIFTKRVKPSDRDEELGRKKLIDAELRERGLI